MKLEKSDRKIFNPYEYRSLEWLWLDEIRDKFPTLINHLKSNTLDNAVSVEVSISQFMTAPRQQYLTDQMNAAELLRTTQFRLVIYFHPDKKILPFSIQDLLKKATGGNIGAIIGILLGPSSLLNEKHGWTYSYNGCQVKYTLIWID